MPRRRIGQETLVHEADRRSSLDEIAALIDWGPIERELDVVHSARRGEASWPPLAMFRAMLLAIWHDLSDVKLADALDDRASFRRFCGFARTEPTPERTAFVRFRRELLRHGLDERLFDEITAQLKSKAVRSRRERWSTPLWSAQQARGMRRQDGRDTVRVRQSTAIKRMSAPMRTPPWSRHWRSRRATPMTGEMVTRHCRMIPEMFTRDSGYRGEVFGKAVRARGGKPRVVATHVWAQSQVEADRRLAEWNGPIHQVRCRIEKIFGTWKRSYGFRRMRWRGLAKAHLQTRFTAIAYNLKRTRNILMTA